MAKRRRLEPQDIAWAEARRAELHLKHEPQAMRSGCSTPPMPFWVCDVPQCQLTRHTLTLVPPICTGGFSTRTIFPDD